MYSISTDPATSEIHTSWLWRYGSTTNLDTFHHDIKTSVWSHILWQPCTRSEENFYCTKYAVLDFDNGMTIKEAMSEFGEFSHIIGTTKSHQKEKNGTICDRFRLILEWNAPIYDLDIYKYNIGKLIRKYGADTQAGDGARLWYPCKEIIQHTSGKPLPVDENVPEEQTALYKAKQYEKKIKKYKTRGVLPKRVTDLILGNVAEGTRNQEIFFSAITLIDMGWSQEKIEETLEALPFWNECNGRATLSSAYKKAGRYI